jgi:FkbM family methyltransferase
MIKKIIKSITYRIILKQLKFLIVFFNFDILNFAHHEIGVGNFGSDEVTGEKYLVKDILKKYFADSDKLVFFDVGANIGEYSKLLRYNFKNVGIISFEPNPKAYAILKMTSKEKNIIVENIGLGEKVDQNRKLFSFKELSSTQLGTTNIDILNNYKINEEIEEINFLSDTIDNYCLNRNINNIDFLKIDVEGGELSVLRGAEKLIKNNKIKLIQFEFNEPNVANRIFLKDFYMILNNYNFYRIKKGKLIELGNYKSCNEIFRYQNILVINKNFSIK